MTHRIDNSLVEMKNELYKSVWITEDPADLERVLWTLRISATLWQSLNYAYKGAEIARDVAHSANALAADTVPQAYRQRKRLEKIAQEGIDLSHLFRQLQSDHWNNQTLEYRKKYDAQCII